MEPQSISETLQRLKGVQKPSKGAPFFTLRVNRPLGGFCAAIAYQWGLTPNQITIVSGLLTYSGIATVALIRPGWVMAVAVTFLLAFGYILDSADGQLARLRGGGRIVGEWLDHLIDAGKIASLHLAVLVSFYRFGVPSEGWLIVPLVFAFFYVVHFFGMLLTEFLYRVQRAKEGVPAPVEPASTLMSILKLPTDYGVLALSFILLGAPEAFRWVYLLLTVANAAYTLMVVVKWYRQLAALG